jgi:hypothetical protein
MIKMITNLTKDMITDDLKASVKTWLLAKAFCDLMAEKVNEIACMVLTTEIELYNDLEVEHKETDQKIRIVSKNDTWLTRDETEFTRYIKVMDDETRKAGLKPDDMPLEHCPLLVAENQLIKADWLIIESAFDMLGLAEEHEDYREFGDLLLCQKNGLEKRKQFIDLCVGLVVNLPGFEKPVI